MSTTNRAQFLELPPESYRVIAVPKPITQNADIRYLGKLLGDVIRAYGGETLFQRIEFIRASSVDRYRGIADATAMGRGLEALNLDDTLAFVRGFMLFSMLANLAEDRQAAKNSSRDDLAMALGRLAQQGIGAERAAALLDKALIVPVLTAHPTEVMRKSMIDHRNRVAELMRHRDLGRTETPEGDLIEQAILRQIALLWQTRPLRRERLYVADEVANKLWFVRISDGAVITSVALGGSGFDVALSPDDARLYVSLLNNTVQVIGRTSRSVVQTITIANSQPRRLGFSALGETVVIADMAGKVHFVR